MSNPKPKKKLQLQVELDRETAQGRYINLAMVNHTETEFVIDCLFRQPTQTQAKVLSRLISSPQHTKKLLRALQENIQRYEARYGEIQIHEAPPDELVLQ